MSPFIVKRSSWHYNLALKLMAASTGYTEIADTDISYFEGKLKREGITSDFCSYWRHVALVPLMDIGLSIIILFLVGNALFASIALNFPWLTVILLLSLSVTIVVILLGVAYLGVVAFQKIKDKFRKLDKIELVQGDSIIKEAYLSWKNKHCSTIEIQD